MFGRISFAIHGISHAWKREVSIKIQFLCAVLLTVFCIIVRPPAFWCALFACMVSLVLSLELANTAVETILDKLHPGFNKEIGFAKDCLAGAVLVASISSLIVFTSFFISKFLSRKSHTHYKTYTLKRIFKSQN